jgi:hypothetical protein
VRGDDWPQWVGPRRDGVWRETGVVNLSPFEFLNRLADHCAAANPLIFSASAAFVELA